MLRGLVMALLQRTLVLAGVIGASFAATSASGQTARTLEGTWRGQVSQAGRDGSYPVVLVITARGATSSYPETPCNGNLKRVGASPNFTFFAEEITRGRYDASRNQGCLDGTVTLHRLGDRLYYSWFGVDGEDYFSATAVLSRDAPATRATTTPTPAPSRPAAAGAAPPG